LSTELPIRSADHHDANEWLADIAREAALEAATEASSQTRFAEASDVANHMANRMLNHTLKQSVGQAEIHHAFERLSDVGFDVVADLAFKNQGKNRMQ
jgi:hypothetical protein